MLGKTYFHTGDLGDVIAALPTIRQLCGGNLVIGQGFCGQGFCRESMKGPRFDTIKPLLEAQPYIASVSWSDAKPEGALDLSNFRQNYVRGKSLAHWQASHLGVETVETAPWLTAPKHEHPRGRVIFARSTRYANGQYPWFALIKRYPDAVFVGLASEHEAFEREFSCRVRYVPTRDLLELASVIAGARLFCGNQSCPWWIACGLGVTTFQETWAHDSNSIIERPNAHYMTVPIFDLEKLPA